MQKRNLHILLVEDNDADILLAKEAMAAGKISKSIHIVKNGEDAINWLAETKIAGPIECPDLILLDINMPKKNGQEVLQFVKQHAGLKHIPVIVFTTSSSQQDIITSYQNHANCFVTKPVDIDSFMDTINKIEEFWTHVVTLPSHHSLSLS